VAGEPIGALGAASVRGRVFDDEARALLEAFADQAAVALHSARLFAAERQARAEAQALERRFHDLVHGVDAVLTEIETPSRRVLFINGRVQPLLGYTVEQWMREPDFWRAHIHPEDRERALAVNEAGIASGGDFVHEYRMVTGDGRTVWIRDSVTVAPERLHSLKVDVTARKRTEALLAGESEVLTLIAAGEPLPRVLDALCRVIDAQDDDISASIFQIIRDVEAELAVAAEVAPQEMPVQPHDAVAEHAVKLQGKPFPLVLLGDDKRAAVPADRGFWKPPANRLITVASHVLVVHIHELELHRPVVRKIYFPPRAVVEFGPGGAGGIPCLREGGMLPIAEVPFGGCGVSQVEPPAEIKQELLPVRFPMRLPECRGCHNHTHEYGEDRRTRGSNEPHLECRGFLPP